MLNIFVYIVMRRFYESKAATRNDLRAKKYQEVNRNCFLLEEIRPMIFRRR